jgi:hypothetical protein
MQRIKFRKGQQKKFLKKVLEKINCPSLRELINRGFDIPYSTLKNYNNESRNLPENLFSELCKIAQIDEKNFKTKKLGEYYGQIKGGKKSKKWPHQELNLGLVHFETKLSKRVPRK